MRNIEGVREGIQVDVLARVGIFWGVRDGRGPLLLVTDHTPLAVAEAYGDFLTHPRGHYEVWEGWRRLGPLGLSRQGLPSVIAWHEYEHFPRGRVVFDTRASRFIVYADRRLRTRDHLRRVLHAFGLDSAHCSVRSDLHYRSARDL